MRTPRSMWRVAVGIVGVVLVWVVAAGCGSKLDKQPLVWQTIHEAARRGDLADVKRHLARGEAVNARDSSRETPEGRNGDFERTYGYSNARLGGETPLHVAAANGHKDVAGYLIAKGADVNACVSGEANTGRTALHYAASGGYCDLVRLLVAKGADVNAKDAMGMTPLHLAAANGCGDVVELLASSGADVSAKTDDGWSPLRWAARTDHASVVELLKRCGASE